MATAFLQVKDDAYGNLASDISDTDTSLTLASGQGDRFPAPGNGFMLTIENEHLLCTARAGDVLTVTRGQEGTAPVAHGAGTDLALNAIASHITELQDAVNTLEGGVYTLVATLASDQATGANTTPVSLTGLVFTYEADSKYRIWFMGRVSPAAATTGCGFQFDLSSAVTSINVIFFHQLANTGTLSGGHSIADDASVGVSSGMPGTSTYTVLGSGLLITTSNTGTAQMRFRSETTAVTTCKAGMTLVVEKVA